MQCQQNEVANGGYGACTLQQPAADTWYFFVPIVNHYIIASLELHFEFDVDSSTDRAELPVFLG